MCLKINRRKTIKLSYLSENVYLCKMFPGDARWQVKSTFKLNLRNRAWEGAQRASFLLLFCMQMNRLHGTKDGTMMALLI